jgi:hypothetical protein
LQVFELARQERPYDEEFLLAALLHDVGMAVDPANHVDVALQALEGTITPRTEALISHHMDVRLQSRDTRRERQGSPPGTRGLRRPDAPARIGPSWQSPGLNCLQLAEALESIRALGEALEEDA